MLFTRTRRLLKRSRSRNAPSRASIAGVIKSGRLPTITSSMTNRVRLGKAKPHSVERIAHAMVASAMRLYGFR